MKCPEFSSKNYKGECHCNEGYRENNGECEKIPDCPFFSAWSSVENKCVCDSANSIIMENLKRCVSCVKNSSPN